MPHDADLMEASLVAVAEAGVEIRHRLFERFFEAYPARRADFLAPEATTIRMTDETLQMMFGLAQGESWVWPLVAELVHTHRSYGDLPFEEYDAFIDMTVDELAEAAGRACDAACRAAWQRRAEELKSMILRAREEWAQALPLSP